MQDINNNTRIMESWNLWTAKPSPKVISAERSHVSNKGKDGVVFVLLLRVLFGNMVTKYGSAKWTVNEAEQRATSLQLCRHATHCKDVSLQPFHLLQKLSFRILPTLTTNQRCIFCQIANLAVFGAVMQLPLNGVLPLYCQKKSRIHVFFLELKKKSYFCAKYF